MFRLISAAVLALSLSPTLSAEPVSAPERQQPPSSHSRSSPKFAPITDHARENAVHIFNAVHSAMRQWGSSLHHNGLGLIPATVPRGTTLYHGTRSNSTPEAFEWLAFEMEHSEGFARSFRGGKGTPPPRPPHPPGKGRGPGKGTSGGGPPVVAVAGDSRQMPMAKDDHGRRPGDDWPDAIRGYFHTYRANRDLKLLYLDGMAAGKTDMGTLDTQDYLLRGQQRAPGFGEYDRAKEVCEIVRAWGLDGVIRMEIGFEAIYCDFFDGLDLVSVLKRPWSDQFEGQAGIDTFEWARAVGQRYDGIGGGRVRLDFSGMVSGFWYPLNVSNPNGRKDMPRLGQVTDEERGTILGRVEEVVRMGGWKEGRVDWQGVVDMIVTRHGDRIEALAEDGDDEAFVNQALVVTNTFVDYPRDESDSALVLEDDLTRESRERCVRHFLTPATVWRDEWTAEDGLIYEAVETVMQRICGDLYAVRSILVDAAPELATAFSAAEIRDVVASTDGDGNERLSDAVKKGREFVRTLKNDLGWSMWKKCKPGCGVAEICFVAMWPVGLKEDHYNPSCQNQTSMMGRRRWNGGGYWESNTDPLV